MSNLHLNDPPPWRTVGEMSADQTKDPLFVRIRSENGGGHSTRLIYENRVSKLYWETYIHYSMDEGPSKSDRLTWTQVWPHPAVDYLRTPPPPPARTGETTKESNR